MSQSGNFLQHSQAPFNGTTEGRMDFVGCLRSVLRHCIMKLGLMVLHFGERDQVPLFVRIPFIHQIVPPGGRWGKFNSGVLSACSNTRASCALPFQLADMNVKNISKSHMAIMLKEHTCFRFLYGICSAQGIHVVTCVPSMQPIAPCNHRKTKKCGHS